MQNTLYCFQRLLATTLPIPADFTDKSVRDEMKEGDDHDDNVCGGSQNPRPAVLLVKETRRLMPAKELMHPNGVLMPRFIGHKISILPPSAGLVINIFYHFPGYDKL